MQYIHSQHSLLQNTAACDERMPLEHAFIGGAVHHIAQRVCQLPSVLMPDGPQQILQL